jgi:phosphatidylglycerophosphatase A
MKQNTDPTLATAHMRKKPRLALAIATSLGVGYAPKAPGTFGSLVGAAVAWLSPAFWLWTAIGISGKETLLEFIDRLAGGSNRISDSVLIPVVLLLPSILVGIVVALIGVRVARKTAEYLGTEDPQCVVIDEVSGQHFTLLLGAGLNLFNWKCLLLGFILFRVFDIWKPFPVRQLEKLPGGWGIMADDWMAGIYAAILLRLALHFGLV